MASFCLPKGIEARVFDLNRQNFTAVTAGSELFIRADSIRGRSHRVRRVVEAYNRFIESVAVAIAEPDKEILLVWPPFSLQHQSRPKYRFGQEGK